MALKKENTATLGNDQFGVPLIVDVTPHNDFAVFHLGERSVTVDLKKLFSFCFMIADDHEIQAQLIPYRKTDILKYVRQHQIVLTKDLKAGESVYARCHIDIPQTVIDALKGLVKPVSEEGWENRRESGIVPEEKTHIPIPGRED